MIMFSSECGEGVSPSLVERKNAGETPALPSKATLDRHFWIAILIAACVVIPRSALILRAHSEYLDDQAHIRRGLAFVTRNPAEMFIMMNDPPLGDGILVLPMVVTGSLPDKPLDARHWPGGQAAIDE